MARIDRTQAAGFLIAGATLGAAVALLFAPQSGIRTRRHIRRLAGNTAERLDAFQEAIRDQTADWVDDISKVVIGRVERGKKLGSESCEKVLQSFDTAKQCVEDGRSRIELLIGTATKEDV